MLIGCIIGKIFVNALHYKDIVGSGLLCPKFFQEVFKKVTYYAQNYAQHHCNHATIHIQFYQSISMVRLQPVVLYIMLCCSALSFILHIMFNIMLMRKLAPYFATNWHDYYITSKDCYMKSDDHNVYKSTGNDF